MAPSRASSVGRFLRVAVLTTLITGLITVAAAACTQSTGTGTPVPVTSATTAPVVASDIAYGPDTAQVLDLYRPVGEGPFPVLVYLHSGGWVAGDHQYVPDFVLDQLDRGVAVVAVDYRLASRAEDGSVTNAFPVPVRDVDRAVRFVRAQAGAWDLDPDAIVLAGASAGGHLALLAAAAPGEFVAPDLPRELAAVSPRLAGVMAFVAPSDLVAFVDEDNEIAEMSLTTFLACPTTESTSCDLERAVLASPATHLDGTAPPAYFAYGTHDTLAPAATQGLPIAIAWAAARGEVLGGTGAGTSTSTSTTAMVQFHAEDAGHNLDRDTVDLAAMEAWLDTVTGRAP